MDVLKDFVIIIFIFLKQITNKSVVIISITFVILNKYPILLLFFDILINFYASYNIIYFLLNLGIIKIT